MDYSIGNAAEQLRMGSIFKQLRLTASTLRKERAIAVLCWKKSCCGVEGPAER